MENVPAKRGLTIALGIYRLLPRGGLEDNCLRIAEELERRGHDVTVFVAGASPKTSLKIVSLAPERRPFFNHSRVRLFAKAFVAATTGRFDRVVAFQPMPGADMLFLADWLRDRADMSWWRRWLPRFRTFAALEAAVFGRGSATRIIGLARPQIAAYRERYGTQPARIAIVPPTMPGAMRRPELRTAEARDRIRRSLGIGSSEPVWLWLGLQPTVKGLDRVLEALNRHPAVHLLVGGLAESDGKAKEFVAVAGRHGMQSRIHWLGYLTGAPLFDTMAAADVLAHPARVDVTGGVILEAIVNGLPVVATANCGFADHIVASGAGKVVDGAFDIDAFAAALGEVCGPGNAVMSVAGVEYGRTHDLTSGTSVVCDLIERDDWAGHPAVLKA